MPDRIDSGDELDVEGSEENPGAEETVDHPMSPLPLENPEQEQPMEVEPGDSSHRPNDSGQQPDESCQDEAAQMVVDCLTAFVNMMMQLGSNLTCTREVRSLMGFRITWQNRSLNLISQILLSSVLKSQLRAMCRIKVLIL
eukprot:s902_g9.t1